MPVRRDDGVFYTLSSGLRMRWAMRWVTSRPDVRPNPARSWVGKHRLDPAAPLLPPQPGLSHQNPEPRFSPPHAPFLLSHPAQNESSCREFKVRNLHNAHDPPESLLVILNSRRSVYLLSFRVICIRNNRLITTAIRNTQYATTVKFTTRYRKKNI